MRRAQGFTLIELLVVITIIAILAGMTFPVLSRARESANQTRCRNNLRQIALALLQYKTDLGDFPPPAIVVQDPVSGQIQYWGGIASLMKAGYMDSPDTARCPDDLPGVRKPKDRNTPQEEVRFYSSYHLQYNYWGYQSAVVHDLTGATVSKPPRFASSVPSFIRENIFPGEACTEPGVGGDPSVYSPFDVRAYYLLASRGAFGCGGLSDAEPELDASTFPLWDCASNDVSAASPMLRNPNPPSNTIVTHCVHHRFHFKDARDLLVRIDAQVQTSPPAGEYDWITQPPF